MKTDKPDTPKCKKCKSRSALIAGYFYYKPDSEPYKNGVKEKAENESGSVYLTASICDKCGHIDNFNVE